MSYTIEMNNYLEAKAKAYHIPFNKDETAYIKLFLMIEDYENLLEFANDRLIDWDTSTYDPEALAQTITDHDEALEEEDVFTYHDDILFIETERRRSQANEWREYITSIKNAYVSSRGC